MARERAGQTVQSLELLGHALVRAAPEGLRSPFFDLLADHPAVMRRYVDEGGVETPFVIDLINRHDRAARAGTGSATASALALTDRELTILRYLASTLSNTEIAAELFLSINTVKTHQRTIYRKLNVGDRRAAVHRARELGLI